MREALDTIEQHPQVRYPWFKGEMQSTLGAVLAAQGKRDEEEQSRRAEHDKFARRVG